MYTSAIPVFIFVKQAFDSKEVKKVIEEWRVEQDELRRLVCRRLLEVGIYDVEPIDTRHLKMHIIDILLNAPEIIKIVDAAERRERALARTKKSYD
ncbi:hypothetical protein [Pseudobacteriovorax antillogorgiicola]|uniref:Uncharacterized protein n=1 Tax=Pseudobacteriovorax antillogorgiicola TaxID=1513793 RepID=A0A1Y6CL76_9BACT|nr:hypothetical protein [Pseudobacteriovorax antillogorgiicola]TCS47605.1 hypothetical protein EDD56_12046 [Pseudobacteriovorax antillogorgiicola]SMF60114.1 hypothetical protein SAMN06296036_12094 [Pseudobacteriovorax antillogorgiicola]